MKELILSLVKEQQIIDEEIEFTNTTKNYVKQAIMMLPMNKRLQLMDEADTFNTTSTDPLELLADYAIENYLN